MEQIFENLKDPSWWFTGIFFILVGVLLTLLLVKWIPALYRKAAYRLPHVLQELARKRQLKMLRRIRSLRFHPLLVIREISRTDALIVIMLIMDIMILIFYMSVRKEDASVMNSLSKIVIFIPMYAVQFFAFTRVKFLNALLKASKRVGTTRCCTVFADSRRSSSKPLAQTL